MTFEKRIEVIERVGRYLREENGIQRNSRGLKRGVYLTCLRSIKEATVAEDSLNKGENSWMMSEEQGNWEARSCSLVGHCKIFYFYSE